MTVGRGIRACTIYQIKSFHFLHDIFLIIISIETNWTARVAAAYFRIVSSMRWWVRFICCMIIILLFFDFFRLEGCAGWSRCLPLGRLTCCLEYAADVILSFWLPFGPFLLPFHEPVQNFALIVQVLVSQKFYSFQEGAATTSYVAILLIIKLDHRIVLKNCSQRYSEVVFIMI